MALSSHQALGPGDGPHNDCSIINAVNDANPCPGERNLNLIGRSRKRRQLIEYLSIRRHGLRTSSNVSDLAKNHRPFLDRLNLMKKLPIHDGCVNTICWNKTGQYILSGSDDRNLCITKPNYLFDQSKDYTTLHKIQTLHLGNIFSAKFMPNSSDRLLVSCSSEGPVIVTDINSCNPSNGLFRFNCHSSAICEVVTLDDDDKVFLSCGEDKTVRLFDIRCHKSCARASTCPHPALIRNSHAVTALTVHPNDSNLILVGRADGSGLVYDRRKLPDVREFSREKAHIDYISGNSRPTMRYKHPLEGVVSQFVVPDMKTRCRFTSLRFSQNGQQVLASYSQDYVYLFDMDRSANFELVQTLPKNQSQDEGHQDGQDSGNNSDGGRRGSNRCVVRTPRLRVRGDWSDTGVNSVPMSDRSRNDNEARNFLQQMSEAVFSVRGRGHSRSTNFVPLFEMITSPRLRRREGRPHNSASNEEPMNVDRAAENEEQDNDILGHGDSDEDEDVSHDDDDEDDDDDDEDDDQDEADEDDEETTSTFAISVECDHVGGRSNSHRYGGGSSGAGVRDNQPSRSNSDDQSNSNQSHQPQPIQSRISPATKMKFKRTIADLKNKYNNIETYHPRVKYQGHRNSRTSFKEAIFWGDDYIMSGSDCGRIMVWERESAKLIMAFPADERIVNCLAPNPHHYVLASSGIDYDIKLWSTQSILEAPLKISQSEMDAIVRNNELMLEEAKQTITVPPNLFFRFLASFAQNSLI